MCSEKPRAAFFCSETTPGPLPLVVFFSAPWGVLRCPRADVLGERSLFNPLGFLYVFWRRLLRGGGRVGGEGEGGVPVEAWSCFVCVGLACMLGIIGVGAGFFLRLLTVVCVLDGYPYGRRELERRSLVEEMYGVCVARGVMYY